MNLPTNKQWRDRPKRAEEEKTKPTKRLTRGKYWFPLCKVTVIYATTRINAWWLKASQRESGRVREWACDTLHGNTIAQIQLGWPAQKRINEVCDEVMQMQAHGHVPRTYNAVVWAGHTEKQCLAQRSGAPRHLRSAWTEFYSFARHSVWETTQKKQTLVKSHSEKQ